MLALLFIIFLISVFVNDRDNDETNHNAQHYPQEVETAMDSLLDFCDRVDSTLNVLKDRLKIESYEQRTTGSR
jgi:hypothetical protein